MTDLKAFGLSWLIGARKLPAAPALHGDSATDHVIKQKAPKLEIYLHHKVDAPKFTNTLIHCGLHALHIPDVDRPYTQNLRSSSRCGDVFGHVLSLLWVPAYNAGIGAEVDQRSNLGAAYCARATSTEDDLVV